MTSLLKLICLLWTFFAAAFVCPASCGAFDGSIAYDAPDEPTITYDDCSTRIFGYDSTSALAADEKDSRTADADDVFAKFGESIAAKRIPCFSAGTKVSTPDGDKNIEDIKVGDAVYAYDFVTGSEQSIFSFSCASRSQNLERRRSHISTFQEKRFIEGR